MCINSYAFILSISIPFFFFFISSLSPWSSHVGERAHQELGSQNWLSYASAHLSLIYVTNLRVISFWGKDFWATYKGIHRLLKTNVYQGCVFRYQAFVKSLILFCGSYLILFLFPVENETKNMMNRHLINGYLIQIPNSTNLYVLLCLCGFIQNCVYLWTINTIYQLAPTNIFFSKDYIHNLDSLFEPSNHPQLHFQFW